MLTPSQAMGAEPDAGGPPPWFNAHEHARGIGRDGEATLGAWDARVGER